MGRSSASTRRWPGSGPMAWPTAHTAIATGPCHTASTTTTRPDSTAPSEAGRRSVAFTTCVGRTASLTQRTLRRRDEMGQPVVHFEVVARDGEKLQSYYAELFDWEVNAENEMK